jgi:hypothetical protein
MESDASLTRREFVKLAAGTSIAVGAVMPPSIALRISPMLSCATVIFIP